MSEPRIDSFECIFMKTAWLRTVSTVVTTMGLVTIATSAIAQSAPTQTTHIKDISPGAPSLTPTADNLDTAAINIESLPLFAIDAPPMAHAPQVAEAIPTASILVPQPIGPADLLKDPNTAWQRFMAQQPRTPKPIDPLAFFELPAMESGLKLNLMNF
jgi:hypothetical protein